MSQLVHDPESSGLTPPREYRTLKRLGLGVGQEGYRHCALRPDGRWLALAGDPDAVELWDVEGGGGGTTSRAGGAGA
jgi:hypothetical protein